MPPSTTPKSNNGRGRVVWQLCGIPRHTSPRCYKRFDRNFLGIGNDGSNTGKQIAMAMVASPGTHSAPQPSIDHAWYADSGATHHITHELDKLTTHEPYHDTDQVHPANGAGMRIHNIGQALLSTPSSRSLALNRVLRAPKATHNLFL